MSYQPGPWHHGRRSTLPLAIYPRRAANPLLVYVFDADHAVKVGVTQGSTIEHAQVRALGISRAAGIDPPTVVAIHAFKNAQIARQVERTAHYLLRHTRTHGEWFTCHPLEAVAAVRQAMKQKAWDEYQTWRRQQQAQEIAA